MEVSPQKMKLTYNWLRDFVEIKIPPKALAEKLTTPGIKLMIDK